MFGRQRSCSGSDLADLKHIGAKGRQNLVDVWSSHLPIISTDNSPNSQPVISSSAGPASNASSVSSSPKHIPNVPVAAAHNLRITSATDSYSESHHEDDEYSVLGNSNAGTAAFENI